MNSGLVVGGVVVLVFGLLFVVDGLTLMDASTSDSFLGFTYTDEESYDAGFNTMILGIVIVGIGAALMFIGVAIGKPEAQRPPPMAPQPYYQAPPPGYYPPQQPPPPMAPPPVQQPPVPTMPPMQPVPAPGPQVQQPFCTACGSKNAAGARFCNNCGNPMDGSVAMKTEDQQYKGEAGVTDKKV